MSFDEMSQRTPLFFNTKNNRNKAMGISKKLFYSLNKKGQQPSSLVPCLILNDGYQKNLHFLQRYIFC